MVQYSNFDRVIESRAHFKNGASSENLVCRTFFFIKCTPYMKVIKILVTLCFFAVNLNAQGRKNDFNYDQKDFDFIFRELGIRTFKFPVKQTSNQLLNILIEEYEDKRLLNTISIIDNARNKLDSIMLSMYGSDMISMFLKPHIKIGSIFFERFIFIEKEDSIVKLKVDMPGYGTELKFNLSGKSLYDIEAHATSFKSENNIKFLEVDNPILLVFLYANKNRTPLPCPTGLSKEQIIERYYYCILVSVEPYKEE